MLELGNRKNSALYVGGDKIKAAYVGSKLVFVENVTITLSVYPSNGGTVSGGGAYERGKLVTVLAQASDGYVFSAWKENGAIVNTSESYTFTADKNRNLVAVFVVKPSRLPAGYTEVEYIQNSDTGKTAHSSNAYFKMPSSTNAVKMQIDLQFGYAIGGSNYFGILGYISNSYYYGINTSDSELFYRYATVEATLVNSRIIDTPYVIEIDSENKSITVNGNNIPTTLSSAQLRAWRGNTNYLFSNGTYSYPRMRVYSLKMWDAGGDLVRDFVPCKNQDGVAGMYEAVSGTFYSSGNTSVAFIPGPAV